MSNKSMGLYPKYEVQKIVQEYGEYRTEPVEDWVFVLNPRTDPGAVEALKAYINWAAANGHEYLAFDLEQKLDDLGRL